MPGVFTLGGAPLGNTLPAVPAPPSGGNIGPSASIDEQKLKARWGERYTSDALNKKFVGMPRGVYYGFIPSVSGLELSLKPDISISFKDLTGSPVLGEGITGGTSGATANIRVISTNFFLIDTLSGTFQVDEIIIGTSGSTAKITAFLQEGLSHARVVSNTPLVAGRTDNMLTISTTDTITLDFTGFTDGTYRVYLTGSYSVGSVTVGSVSSRTTPEPDQITEILVCNVTKSGTILTVAANSGSTPPTRQEPFANAGQRIGFMPSGSIENLLDATLTTQEVIAARVGMDGNTAPTFDISNPQTTGLPKRLKDDLSRQSMASRLGKQLVVVRGNDYAVIAPLTSPINVSGSFAARTRDHQPFRDVSTGDLPAGVDIPLVMDPGASDNITLNLSLALNTFATGDAITGLTSGATGIVRSFAGLEMSLNELSGVFRVGEGITSASLSGSGTIGSISNREGVITAEAGGGGGDTVRNLVSVVDTFTGKKPVDAVGNPIFGRLLFGPNGTSAPGGGSAGELLVGSVVGEFLSFTQGSTSVVCTAFDPTTYFLAGDIIEGADNRWYEIDSIVAGAPGGTLTLTAGKPYVGATATAGNAPGVVAGPRRRRRYLLSLVSLSGGVESNQTLTPGTNIPSGAAIRPFFPCWISVAQSNYSADLEMRAPGDAYTLASTAVPGLGFNASGLGGGAGAGLPVIGAVRTIQTDGTSVGDGNFHTINFTSGTISSSAPGVIDINSPGGPGPAGGTAGGPAGPVGPTGPGLGVIYAYQMITKALNSGITTGSDNFVFAGPLFFYMVNSAIVHAAIDQDSGYIESVAHIAGSNTIQFNFSLDGGGAFFGQSVIFGAAAAG